MIKSISRCIAAFGETGRLVWAIVTLLLQWGLLSAAGPDGLLTLRAFDEDTKEPLAARFELRDARGRPVRLRPENAVAAADSIYFDGSVTLQLARGQYTFLAEAGPEFITRPGNFAIDRHAEDSSDLPFSRKVDMHKEGWWSGDFDVQLRQEDLPLIMKARAVDFVPLTVAVNDQGRCRTQKPLGRAEGPAPVAVGSSAMMFGPWSSLDSRRGGGLLAVSFDKLPDVCRWKADDSSLASATAAHDAGATVVTLTPYAWDLPLWIAAGKVDAIDVINRHSQLNAVVDNENDGRPRDKINFPDKFGNGRYAESIYHHLLNCGLRIPPAAGSGAGAGLGGKPTNTPLGTNRVCVQCGETCTRQSWMEGFRAGRVVATNGPLLRTKVEGEAPGHVFQLERSEKREFQISLNVAFYEKTQVEYLEIVKDGKAVNQFRFEQLAKVRRVPPVTFDSSGWFLVRAVTNNPNVYQFATTGPYYVEADYKPRISRASVKYFIDWLDEAAKKFAGNAAVVAEIEAARPFWNGLLKKATVD
jgi:hypothetical protein